MVHQEQRDKDILFSPAAVTITQMCLCCDVVFLLSFQKKPTNFNEQRGSWHCGDHVDRVEWQTCIALPSAVVLLEADESVWKKQPWGSLNGQKQTINDEGEIVRGIVCVRVF